MNSFEEDDSDIEDYSFQDFYFCPVCMDRYSLTKAPKTPIILQCHHSLCKACCLLLVDQARVQANHFGYPYLHRSTNVQIISCPVCRKQLQIREGEYPVNFYITKFLEEYEKKRSIGQNLALWCKDCKSVAKEVCRLHSTVRLGDSLCNLATNHKYIASTLLEIVSTYIESSKKAASDSDISIKKLDSSMGEMRSFISHVKAFLKILRNEKQEIHATFTSCRDTISGSVEKTKACEPFACNSDDLLQDSQTWLQSSIKVDDNTLRDRARVVCQSTQVKLVKTLEENIKNLQAQELAINSGKKLQDNFNREQGNINSGFFRSECKRLIGKFKRAFDECFQEIEKMKDLFDIPNDYRIPFGKRAGDKPELLAKELNPSLTYFIEMIQAEKGTGSGASSSITSAASQKASVCQNNASPANISIEVVPVVTFEPTESNSAITVNDENVEPLTVDESNRDELINADEDGDNASIDDATDATINEISRMAAIFFKESQCDKPALFISGDKTEDLKNHLNFLQRFTDDNHFLFPNPVKDHEFPIIDNELSSNSLRSPVQGEHTDDVEKTFTTVDKCHDLLKRVAEVNDHDHVKKVRSSRTNSSNKTHKRRILKTRKSYYAEVLNISSGSE